MYQPPGIFKRFKTWARNLLGRKISAPIEQAQAALPICLNRLRRRAANIFNNLPVQPRLKRFQVRAVKHGLATMITLPLT